MKGKGEREKGLGKGEREKGKGKRERINIHNS